MLALGIPFIEHTRKVKRLLSGISRVARERVSATSPRLVAVKEKLLGLARKVIVPGKEVQAQAERELKEGKGAAWWAVCQAEAVAGTDGEGDKTDRGGGTCPRGW